METFELILFLLTAVIASSILDKFLPPLSLPLVQIALGAALALFVVPPLCLKCEAIRVFGEKGYTPLITAVAIMCGTYVRLSLRIFAMASFA